MKNPWNAQVRYKILKYVNTMDDYIYDVYIISCLYKQLRNDNRIYSYVYYIYRYNIYIYNNSINNIKSFSQINSKKIKINHYIIYIEGKNAQNNV